MGLLRDTGIVNESEQGIPRIDNQDPSAGRQQLGRARVAKG